MAKAAMRKAPDTDNLRRNLSFQPQTIDEEARTFWAVAATETPVPRWYGSEILSVSEGSIEARRLDGLPVLDSHNRSSVLNHLGRVIEWKIVGRELLVKIELADGERGQHALDLVKSGMLHKVSVGYRIHEYEEADARDGSAQLTATLWEPIEVSLVSVPADHNATIRSERKMAKAVTKTRRQAAANPVRSQANTEVIEEEEDDDLETRSVSRSDRFERQLDDIIERGVGSGLDRSELEEAIEKVRTIDEARAVAFDMMTARQNKTRTDPHRGEPRQRQGETEAQIVDALAVRLGARAADGDNPLRNVSLVQIGRRALEACGATTRNLGDNEVADVMIGRRSPTWAESSRGMHTTSDFPLLLQAAGNRALLERYGPMSSPLKGLSMKRNARDFRTQSFIRPGEAPKLAKVGEHGEITAGTLSEDSRGLKLETYAKLFAITRQAMINDDLGAFSDFINAFAQSAAETEGDLFFELLSANSFAGATLSDTLPFFHADRGNKAAAGAAISVEAVSAGRAAMRQQKNVNGTGTAGVVPAVLLVGPKKETEAEKLVASLNAATTETVNPFAGKLRVEVENRYSGNGWWLFADPQQRPALMHGYLSGMEGPMIETQQGWEVLGTQFRCVLDFGAGVMDYRAAYYNAGA
jgi:HK97 family phage prohead protease